MVMGIDIIPNTIISTLSGEEVLERTEERRGGGGGRRGVEMVMGIDKIGQLFIYL